MKHIFACMCGRKNRKVERFRTLTCLLLGICTVLLFQTTKRFMVEHERVHCPLARCLARTVSPFLRGLFRYVVGALDGNVDPIKAGKVGAEAPPMLVRQLSTDGIDLVPPEPEPEEPAREKLFGSVFRKQGVCERNFIATNFAPRFHRLRRKSSRKYILLQVPE